MSVTLLSELRRLNRQQWMTEDELRAVQLAKLKRQIARAYEYSRFYRDRFTSAGLHPSDFKSLDDLQRLPVTTKQELIAAGSDASCSNIDQRQCLTLKTSGSSGSPISIPFTRHDKDHRVVKELRTLLANGYRPIDRMLILVDPDDIPKKKAVFQRVGLLRREYISIFADEDEQIQRIQSSAPEVIYSYTSCLRILAERILSDSANIPTPKILISAAEVMDPAARRLLKEGFGIEPIDFYGSMEFGWIAWQCPARDGYHINSDCLIVECLRDGRQAEPGEEGELVITNLHSDATPLIRYSVGDAGVPLGKRCSCGRTLPMLERVSGRTADCIVLKGGRKLSPYYLTCAVEDVPGVRRFQIVQEAEDSIRIRLLSRDGQNVKTEELRAAVQRAVGGPVAVDIEFTDVLPLEPSGKFKVVKSLVGSTTTGAAVDSSHTEEAADELRPVPDRRT